MTRTITEEVTVEDLAGKTIKNVYFEVDDSGHNHQRMYIKTEFSEYEIGHYNNCCERSKSLIAIGEISDLIGSTIIYITSTLEPELEEYPDQYTVFESIRLVTNTGNKFIVDWKVKSAGCWIKPGLLIEKTYEHCIFTEV